MTVVAVALVVVVLVFAIARPRGLSEIVIAAPAAALVVVLGIVTPQQAGRELRELAPTVGFLAAVLALGHLADAMGVFTWIAAILHRRSGADPGHLLVLVFAAAALTTAVLSLDATVVLLTPAVIGAARRLGVPARPHSYATVHLSNSASTLLPISNLTNLLAFSATGLTFLHFTALMALPWLVTIAIEFMAFRLFFAGDLDAVPSAAPVAESSAALPAPRLALGVIGAVLAGFASSEFIGVAPVWVATAGVVVLAVPALRAGRTNLRRVVYAVDVWFCAFVLTLGVVVAGVADGPVGSWIGERLPTAPSFAGLLAVAVVAALAANLLNNLPATLLLLAAFGPTTPPEPVLAMLIGVNLGPNLTYVGSLATMLWRRVSARAGVAPSLGTFTVLGLITTPLTILAAVTALWLVT